MVAHQTTGGLVHLGLTLADGALGALGELGFQLGHFGVELGAHDGLLELEKGLSHG